MARPLKSSNLYTTQAHIYSLLSRERSHPRHEFSVYIGESEGERERERFHAVSKAEKKGTNSRYNRRLHFRQKKGGTIPPKNTKVILKSKASVDGTCTSITRGRKRGGELSEQGWDPNPNLARLWLTQLPARPVARGEREKADTEPRTQTSDILHSRSRYPRKRPRLRTISVAEPEAFKPPKKGDGGSSDLDATEGRRREREGGERHRVVWRR